MDVQLYLRFIHYHRVLDQHYISNKAYNPLQLIPAVQDTNTVRDVSPVAAPESCTFVIKPFDTDGPDVEDEAEATLAYRALLAKRDLPQSITSEMSCQHSTGGLIKYAFEFEKGISGW